MMLFGEKYGDTVRVLDIGSSRELCGGTHVARTGDIGLFKIVTETGIAAGVRRIEALTGNAALRWVQDMVRAAAAASDAASVPLEAMPDKIQALLKRQKELEKQIAAMNAAMALADMDQLLAARTEIQGISLLASTMPLDSAKTLREIGDKIRDKMPNGIIVLGGEYDGKAALLALVSKEHNKRVKAGDLVNQVAAIVGGKGGGRPDMAQAGGSMPDKLEEAIAQTPAIIARMLG